MTEPDRNTHRAYEQRHREVDAETRARFRELADLLGLPPSLRPAFVAAGLRAAQFHAADSALVDHEIRSHHSWPAEGKLAREEMQANQWKDALQEIRVLTESPRHSEPAETPAEGKKHHGAEAHYRPISSISKPPED